MSVREPILQAELQIVENLIPNETNQYFDLQLENQPFDLPNTSEVELNGCVFKSVDFSDLDLSASSFIDCVFISCIFSNANMEKSLFRRVRFERCNLVGSDCSRSSMQDVTLLASNCRYANLSFMTIKTAYWKDTRFDQANLNDGNFKGLKLDECSFVECDFVHTPLAKIDFSSSSIDGLMLSGEELKGVIVNEYQAVALARLLGIVIK